MSIPKILKIIRVHIVVGGALAFSLGALLAVAGDGTFDPARFVLGYTVVLLGDLSTHYSNDYFDVEVDKSIEQKKFFAGSGILVDNPDLRSLARRISLSLLAFSNVLAAMLVLFLGAPIEFFIVILGADLVGWFYSAPPLRLTSRGFGELAVACVTGFAIPGLGYLALRGQFDPLFFCLAGPFVMYGLMLSLSLEAPDAEVDRKGGRRNLVVRKGARSVFSLVFVLTVAVALAFFVYGLFITSMIVNFGVVFLFSLAPLGAGFIGFAGILREHAVNLFSALNVGSLFAFNMLMAVYLLALVMSS
jgi:1,4-dihydroxy-2-naphthoate octaprenyltransferase